MNVFQSSAVLRVGEHVHLVSGVELTVAAHAQQGVVADDQADPGVLG